MLGARADEGGATIRKALMAVPMDNSVDLSFDLTLSLPQQDVTKPQRSWVGVGRDAVRALGRLPWDVHRER